MFEIASCKIYLSFYWLIKGVTDMELDHKSYSQFTLHFEHIYGAV